MRQGDIRRGLVQERKDGVDKDAVDKALVEEDKEGVLLLDTAHRVCDKEGLRKCAADIPNVGEDILYLNVGEDILYLDIVSVQASVARVADKTALQEVASFQEQGQLVFLGL